MFTYKNIFSEPTKIRNLVYKRKLILILKINKIRTKKYDQKKTVNLLIMATIFFNYCIITPSTRFACLQNKFFRHFIPSLLIAQSTGAIEYTVCIFDEGQDSPNECPVAQSARAIEYTVCFSAKG